MAWYRIFALLAAASLAPCADWMTLFDGTNTAGWGTATSERFPLGSWTLENGTLTTLPEAEGIKYDLWTQRKFRYFELEFDWKLSPHGNTGVKYSVQDWIASLQRGGKFLFTRKHDPFRQGEVQPGDLANEYTYGLEFQLMDDSNEDGPKPDQKTGALYGRIAPDEQLKRFTIGEWNRARLVVSERRVEHWINGKRVLSYTWDDPRIHGMQLKQEGSPIVLQHHHAKVWFRNIRVMELQR